ncbi:hypothetical protein [Deinococcus radiophilus]|uniref:hypothetical protein n=1 Tax=Deinococcus radiophilus TaxID=32062 RepID=UPI00360B1012
MSELSGRIGGVYQGYDLRADWDGERLSGRIGGVYQGKDLDLTHRQGKSRAELVAGWPASVCAVPSVQREVRCV